MPRWFGSQRYNGAELWDWPRGQSRLRHGGSGLQRYSPADLDLFALYILPAEAWYLIPSATVLLPTPKLSISVSPHGLPRRSGQHTPAHDYESYKEAWPLLYKSRRALAARLHQR